MDDQRDYAEEAANASEARKEQISEFFDGRDEVLGTDESGNKWMITNNPPRYILTRYAAAQDIPFVAVSDFWELFDLSLHFGITWK